MDSYHDHTYTLHVGFSREISPAYVEYLIRDLVGRYAHIRAEGPDFVVEGLDIETAQLAEANIRAQTGIFANVLDGRGVMHNIGR